MSLKQAPSQKNQHGTHQEIYQVVALIPYGRVATYGQIARLAGLPRHARLVGYALNRLSADNDLPWHRVVNSQGSISLPVIDHAIDQNANDKESVQQKPSEQGSSANQKTLLEQEGVVFINNRINLSHYQWQP